MKQTDFERLKAVCEKEGFELKQTVFSIGAFCNPNQELFQIKKKDIWEGVEFAECEVDSSEKNVKKGKIYPCKIVDGCLEITGDYFHTDLYGTKFFKPSTEQAYIEQLKKEAFERFGEIKEGDRFDRTSIDEKWGSDTVMEKFPFGTFHWKYDKSGDCLFIGRYGIYKEGKWATRVKERVEVNPKNTKEVVKAFKECLEKDKDQFVKFLASQVEKYLNNEIE